MSDQQPVVDNTSTAENLPSDDNVAPQAALDAEGSDAAGNDSDEDSEDVPEDLENYMSDGEEEHEEDIVHASEVPKDTSCLIVVGGVPSVGADKVEKLQEFLTKLAFSYVDRATRRRKRPEEVTLPFDEEKGTTKGFAIVRYPTAKIAAKQRLALDGLEDYDMSFKAYEFAHVCKLCLVPDTYKERKVEDNPWFQFAKQQSKRELLSWLGDKRVRDQFVVRHALKTEVHWADTVGEPLLAYGGQREKDVGLNWCEMHVKWSPRGSYLLTQHVPGVALWGGSEWEKVLKIPCRGVTRVQFSPQEKFLVTWNGGGEFQDTYFNGGVGGAATGGKRAVELWNLEKGASHAIKTFDYEVFTTDRVSPEWDAQEWSYFKWSSDDRYFARVAHVGGDASDIGPDGEKNPNILRVYDSVTLKSQSIIAKGIRSCEWSPGTSGPKGSNNIIAYWEPEMKQKNRHASVTLRQYPSKKLLRQQTLYNVSDCNIYWHNNGDFMCAHVERHSASKKTYFTNLELFRVRDRDIPVETLEIRETVHAFAWEPNGVRFCVIHGTTTNTVSIYTMHAVRGGDAYALQWQLDQKKCTGIYWSPIGRHAVLAGTGSGNYHGSLDFIDADDKVLLASGEHFMCKHVLWDAGGRTVATAATLTIPKHGHSSQSSDLERGYRIWTFQGDLLVKKDVRDFYQFLWRPRPASILSPQQQEDALKNLKELGRRYKDQDRIMQESDALAKALEKSKMREEFRTTMDDLHQWYLSEQEERVKVQGYDDSALPVKEESFTIRQVLDEKREAYKPDDEDAE